MSKTKEFAVKRLNEEAKRAEETGDWHDAVYWSAYVDGVCALEREFKCFKQNNVIDALKTKVKTDIDFELKSMKNAINSMMPSYSHQAYGAITAYKDILKFLGEETEDRVSLVGEFIIPEEIECTISAKLKGEKEDETH